MGGTARWEPPSPAELQAMLADYTVERLVGQGGMGAVNQARQISLNRPVALKIITDDLDDFDDFNETEVNYVERFKNEDRAMARLSHPGIVAVYDFGQTSKGLLYIGMEYVEGTDVARMLEQQERLLPKHALAITAQVCTALPSTCLSVPLACCASHATGHPRVRSGTTGGTANRSCSTGRTWMTAHARASPCAG